MTAEQCQFACNFAMKLPLPAPKRFHFSDLGDQQIIVFWGKTRCEFAILICISEICCFRLSCISELCYFGFDHTRLLSHDALHCLVLRSLQSVNNKVNWLSVCNDQVHVLFTLQTKPFDKHRVILIEKDTSAEFGLSVGCTLHMLDQRFLPVRNVLNDWLTTKSWLNDYGLSACSSTFSECRHRMLGVTCLSQRRSLPAVLRLFCR